MKLKTQDEFKHALGMLHRGQLKDAEITLKRIYIDAPEIVNPLLIKHFREFHKVDLQEEALFIGKLILYSKPKDLKLLNEVGDISRKLRQFDKAAFYYKQAIKFYPKDLLSHGNLAACRERVNLYGEDLLKVLNDYGNFEDFIIPEEIVLNDTGYIEEIDAVLIRRLIIHRNEKLQVLLLRQELLEISGKEREAKAISMLVRKEEDTKLPTHLESDETQKLILQIYHNNWKFISQNDLQSLEIPIFNLGRYAFFSGNFNIARGCFLKLIQMKCQLMHVDLLWAMASWKLLERTEAIVMLQKIQDKYPNDRYISTNLGIALKLDGNLGLAYKYLLRGAITLKRLSGEFNYLKIIEMAKSKNINGKFKEALFLYQSIATEARSPKIWILIGDLEIKTNQHIKAIDSLHKAKALTQESKAIDKSLAEIHHYLVNSAEKAFEEGKHVIAVEKFEQAMRAHERVNTLQRAAEVYSLLKNEQRVQELMRQCEVIQEKQKVERIDIKRNEHLKTGKKLMRGKKYDDAIDSFEEVFKIRPDKDVLMLLAHIYKGLNRQMALRDLMVRWKRFEAYEEKQKKYAQN
ncbi:MAG: hypothetical protein GY786_12650 [Proteobacteria bacterium]|nr:hypothetical protein [Pseudomonadota bacterium]